jgi:small multidrug resistance family-3 protein
MEIAKIFGLFIATAIAEIIGCYLPYLWLKQNGSIWVLLPAALSLCMFVWLLSIHPTAAGRVYAAYGGVYISTAICWLWLVDAVKPTTTDLIGTAVCLVGAGIIMLGAKAS